MRIASVLIENFRAIQKLELEDLGRTIVVAGQNGSGKSCILDAIRLIKSIYGGYQPNEYTMWFGEYNIPVDGDPQEFLRLLRDRQSPMHVAIEFELEDSEKKYLLDNLDELAVVNAWKEIAPSRGRFGSGESLATRQRIHAGAVASRASNDSEALRAAIGAKRFKAELHLRPSEAFTVTPSLVLEYLFSNFRPQELGVIDFHGSNRHYAREQIGNIDLNVQQREQHFQTHALYNQQNKYQHFKAQLAAQYVRELLSERAGVQGNGSSDLTETLKELFATFFPGKTFLGPVPTPDGRLAFPVRTLDGKEHDIDDLSSGEKEVLYGYLRLRNATPRNSIVLIDEPELHLNPRLVRGLSNFYHQHLTLPLNCQLWLITHSDTLLRDSVGRPDFSIFYVRSAEVLQADANQASPARSVQAAILPLIEDLAGYKPAAKVILLEGGGETKFDATVISELFPLFSQEVNLVSAGPKARVRSLLSTLDEVSSLTDLGTLFYSISDRDSDATPGVAGSRALTWDRYHIENYLLEPAFIWQAIRDLHLSRQELHVEHVQELLRQAAERSIPSLVRHTILRDSSDLLLSAIEIRPDKTTTDVAATVARAVQKIPGKVLEITEKQLNPAALDARVSDVERGFRDDLVTGRWMESFRGRDVLRQFVATARLRIEYDVLRFAIITAMKHARYQPPGMKAVLDQIHVVERAESTR